MVKQFIKNYTGNILKDKLKGLIFNIIFFTLIYVIFDPLWWQMLIIAVVYIAIRVAWTLIFKQYSRIFGFYNNAKDVYQAIPEESKTNMKNTFETKRNILNASIRKNIERRKKQSNEHQNI